MSNFIFLQSTEAIASAQAAADSIKNSGETAIKALGSKSPDEIVSSLTESAIHFGLKVLAALIILGLGAWIIKMVRKGVRKRMGKRKENDSALISFTDSLVSIILWILLICSTIAALGINTTGLAALLAAGGMAIGMAMSGTVQNFTGGIMLLIFKPFKSGDFIEAQGFSGTVKEMNIVSTKIITVDNKEIIIPNGALFNGTINNYSSQTLRRVDWGVDVSYGSDSEAVKKEIMQILIADKRVLDSSTSGAQDPFIALAAMKESSIEYTVRAWVKSSDYWGVKFDINDAIYTTLPKKGISFPFPQLDVHMIKES